ncbi:acyltransferase [Paraglaciecola sp.]|uniref:acyltransferase family protein n=1 Tax=Paraglaciecola sp. TaxID=1920173 RepID=UPI00273F634F|nr:acyltransferase [Paraglaciecola sp.]MDP5030989.1 acyltransferase [Paraglaciecola sp.]
MNYLTSLRGFAAILVVLYHFKSHLLHYINFNPLVAIIENSYLAVDFFFVLSGFILSYKYNATFSYILKWKDFFNFLVKRVARIAPLHIFILISFLLIPVAHLLTGRPVDQVYYGVEAFFIKLFLIDTWVINERYWSTWNTPSWTISAELFAYLLLPFIMFTMKKWSIFLRLLFCCSLCFLLAILHIQKGSNVIGNYIGTLGLLRCFTEFNCGILVYLISTRMSSIKINTRIGLFILAIVLLLIAMSSIPENFLYIPILFSFLLLTFISFENTIHNFLSYKPFVFLGDISYSIYLNHYFVKAMVTMLLIPQDQIATVKVIFIYIFFTILLSVFTFKFIEVPSRKWLTKKGSLK